MEGRFRFPNELWLEVCPYLPLNSVRSLSSTNRSLYAIARPLSFTEFKLYPYPYEYNPPQELLADALARLSFYSSQEIAPLVRTCTARQSYHSRRWPACDSTHGDDARDGGAPHALMNAFFVRLPHFTGLQRLYADRIHFTRAGLEALCALPPLRHAEFDACTLTTASPNAATTTLRVANFVTRHITDAVWLALLCHDSLRSLKLSDLLLLARPSVGPLPYVHSLTAIPYHLMIWDALTIFAKFPALRVFITDYTGVLRNLTPAQEGAIFPLLEEYTGAAENLHVFTQRPTLAHITIDGGIAFSRLPAEFRGVAMPLSNITSFTAQFSTASAGEWVFGGAEMDAIFTWFPRLKKLQLTFYPDVEDGGAFVPRPTSLVETSLAANPLLPDTLESISLAWDFPELYSTDADSDTDSDGRDLAPALPTDEFPATAVRDALISRCPALGYIYFNGYHFAYVWWKTSWVWEATAGSYAYASACIPADAENLRGRKDERMYGPPILLT
ncbi:hypothetical protein GGX14DRAFT_543043 [Mycena pura]|uniref:F-box domain-containing protein n=1 Tax=Mycena pura TaxID=153505 RepID=A0AAD6YF45_9AGAR|nr:hypothetical protein GGX14DRAFT_543043 [Mycena pura]